MGKAWSSQISLNIYQTAWCHIPKDNNFQLMYMIVTITFFRTCLLCMWSVHSKIKNIIIVFQNWKRPPFLYTFSITSRNKISLLILFHFLGSIYKTYSIYITYCIASNRQLLIYKTNYSALRVGNINMNIPISVVWFIIWRYQLYEISLCFR